MKHESWLAKHAASLAGKTVAVSGSTGGLGKELCRYLAHLGAQLVLLDRNQERSEAHERALTAAFPDLSVRRIPLDLADMTSVQKATEKLKALPLDVFIHNAGAYSIPRALTDAGYDNVFQINFVAPYYMIRELLPTLRARGGRVVAVGSIAHRYSKSDAADVDFRTRRAASRVYGNAKRYLMASLYELFREEREASLAIVHPGITFTGITAHYPKVIFAIIKHPMKIIFMKPSKAALSLLLGLFVPTEHLTWIGPRVFDVWGMPRKSRLHSIPKEECKAIAARAQTIYEKLKCKP